MYWSFLYELVLVQNTLSIWNPDYEERVISQFLVPDMKIDWTSQLSTLSNGRIWLLHICPLVPVQYQSSMKLRYVLTS